MKISYSEKYIEKVQKKYLWNFTVLKQYMVNVLGVKEELVGSVIRRCSDYQYGRIKKISDVEQKVYVYLKSLGLNPQRIYKWFLSSRLPEDLKASLLSGKISQRKAINLARNKEFGRELDVTWRLMDLIRKTVREVI